MKGIHLFVLMVATIFTTSCGNGNRVTYNFSDLAAIGIKGKVKKITRTMYETDSTGAIPADGKYVYVEHYTFDDKGRITTYNVTKNTVSGPEVTEIAFEYTATDTAVLRVETNKKDGKINNTVIQKKNDTLWTENSVDEDETFASSEQKNVNSRGNVTAALVLTKSLLGDDDANGYYAEYTYDDNGNMIQQRTYSTNDLKKDSTDYTISETDKERNPLKIINTSSNYVYTLSYEYYK